MLKKIIINVLGLCLLSGCTDNFRGYFKRSANNKLIDRTGFEGRKRPPLYNKKYIATAKRNVVEENFDDEEEELLREDETETINPTLRNRKMYLKMIKQDMEHIKDKPSPKETRKGAARLAVANNKVKSKSQDDASVGMQKQLENIKALLNETKQELEKHRCPGTILPQDDSIKNSEIIFPNKLEEGRVEQNNKLDRNNLKKSEIKKRFLTEDFDEPITNESLPPRRINNTIIEEYEKTITPPREI
ncbi:hypothetical protein [Candidatus Tisiphia endosymbiont of Nemotelus uliginosus]|uniref:hypothetical protein n=1 Tax=Candidatus Tisiphia endosymbiont of Nemotelus uliginosus TaxID=3077926 RepID=UPI0035C88C11